MRWIALIALLLSGGFSVGQSNQADSQQPTKGEVTVQGCVEKSGGDYVLFKQDPGMTYELATTDKTKLRQYLGQRVEIVGTKSPSTSTTSDATMPTGSPTSTTLTVSSIRTISKECRAH